MLTTSIFALALVAGSAIAQSTTTGSTGSTALNFTYLDIANVDPQEAASWCIGERTGCQTLCDGNAPTNDCDTQKLTYKCLCEDGSTPDLAKYKNTLPDFVCQANFAGCIKAHPNDAVGQGKCKTNIQDTCGTLNITDYNKGSGSGTSSGSGSGSGSETSSPSSTGGSGGAGSASETTGGSKPSSTSDSGAAAATSKAAAVANGMDIGAGVLAAGLFGVFGYIL
ncbi:hypothetical protein VC83_00264 [Pseudogymnoascus destructans]|uniref:DUF7707 domain-containing protein n=2 Tax=Pseudogymnoascus destructans TaxID=655981 RepID=L8G822_PSED2|nr:uncharacterized protein VC83_00264 [Pseudogymnoascus destructans]ELR09019.1 hypothetical protein GMDG_00637 [Pseudogymnoascus destructans 20631-21]OAF62948.1 hypothetical protein VC83_00264 [Pseudogymnoascus destructans]